MPHSQRQNCPLRHLSQPSPSSSCPPPPALTPLTGSHRSEQHFVSLQGFYGHSQRSRRDVWGPRRWRINFLLIFFQLIFFLLHPRDFQARGGPQGEAGGTRGRVPEFSLCSLHLLPGRHQQRGGRALLQGPQLLHGWRGQTACTGATEHKYVKLSVHPDY